MILQGMLYLGGSLNDDEIPLIILNEDVVWSYMSDYQSY